MILLVVINIFCASGIFSLKIDEFATKDDPNYKPQWVINAISKNPSLEKSNSISKYCQELTVFSDITFPGKLCFVSVWRDVSLLEIKADPRREFCETLSWGYASEFDEVCTLLDKYTSNCYGNYNIKLKEIGYIPTICPQFPCIDFDTLKSGISLSPHNQIVNIKQPNDTSGVNINVITFDSTSLGYIRISKNNKIYQNANECPSNMYGISYYWSDSRQKSCTVLSQQQSKSTISYSAADEQYIEQHCKDNSEEHFIGCLYTSKENCLSSLQKPEYVDIFEPTKLRVSISIFIEAQLVGEHENTLEENDKKIEELMANANSEDNSEFKISSKITIAEFSFSFSEISKNFRICSDELFTLQNFIPGLSPQTTLKFCLRATNWKTFMPDNGELYVYFIPHFSATIRKKSSMSSLGFAGGIEYTANPFISFLNLQQPTDWLNKPDKNAVTREDLKWFKPTKIHSRSEYKRPPNFTIIVLAVFLGAMGIYYVLMFKDYVRLKKEEEIVQNEEEERTQMEERARLEHEEWETNIIGKDKQHQEQLHAFKKKQSSELLDGERLTRKMSEIVDKNRITIVSPDALRRSKIDEYSDIQISEDELNELMNDNTDSDEHLSPSNTSIAKQ